MGINSGFKGLISRSKIPAVCDLETLTLRWFGPDFGCFATGKQWKHSIQRSLEYFLLVRGK